MPAAPDSAYKAEQANAARKARRAALEAEALRKNLLRRKAQSRERAGSDAEAAADPAQQLNQATPKESSCR